MPVIASDGFSRSLTIVDGLRQFVEAVKPKHMGFHRHEHFIDGGQGVDRQQPKLGGQSISR